MANCPISPAESLDQAINLTIDNANRFNDILNGDITTFVPTCEGGQIPSVSKALAEAAAYKVPLAWDVGQTENDLLQPRDYEGNTYVPLTVPAIMGATPSSSLWRLFVGSLKAENVKYTGLTPTGNVKEALDSALQTVATLAELQGLGTGLAIGAKREYQGLVYTLKNDIDYTALRAADNVGYFIATTFSATAAWVADIKGRYQFKHFGAVAGQNVDTAISKMLGTMYITGVQEADLGEAGFTNAYEHSGFVLGSNANGDYVRLYGSGGHSNGTVLTCTNTSAVNGVRVDARSSGFQGVRINGSPARRAALDPTDNVFELVIGGEDSPTSSLSTSRTLLKDVWVTNGGSHGFNTIWNMEFADWDNITVQGCKGHPVVFDDGTTQGYTNKLERVFMVTIPKIRAFECGGQFLVGVNGQTQSPRQILLMQPECLDIAQSKIVTGVSNAYEGFQMEIRAPNVTIFQPDIENQRYNGTTDQLGNSKPQLTIPVSGIKILSTGVRVIQPYSSSLYKHGEITGNNCTIEDPISFSGTYGINAAVGWSCDVGSTLGFRFRALTSTNTGATLLLDNNSKSRNIEIDGVMHLGINFSAYDWALPVDPVTRTISGGVLLVKESYVSVVGETIPDSMGFLRMIDGAAADAGRAGCSVRLVNNQTYDITLNHGSVSANGGMMYFKSGANVVLRGAGAGNNQREVVLNFNPTQNAWYEA